MDIQYIPYDQKYLDSLLICWNQTLIHDPISKNRFLDLIIYDENFDESLAMLALINQEVVGFCYGVKRKVSYYTKGLEPKRGWINYLFVSEAYQNQGIAQTLYDLVEKKIAQLGATQITLCAYSPNYTCPGIDIRYEKGLQFLKKNKYPFSSSSVSMQRSLWDFELSSDYFKKMKNLQEEGIRIIPYHNQYFSKLMTFIDKEFEPGWKRNIILALQRHDACETIILCVDKHDNILGYCMRKIDGNDSRFGPIGVANHLRSKGLGGLLFDSMMNDMKQHGLLIAYFLWTSGDAIRFYERHGMSIYRTYKTSRKEI